MRTLPTPSRGSGARWPTASQRKSVVPSPSHRLLTDWDVPPLPTLRFVVAADLVVVVRAQVEIAVVARVTAVLDIAVTTSATARADGGTKEVDAVLSIDVATAAVAFVRYRRTAVSNLTVTSSAHAAVHARARLDIAVNPAATSLARAFVAADLPIAVTSSAEVVAIGGQVPVDAVLDVAVNMTATARARIYRDAALALTVAATAERLLRMRAAAVQDITVAATAAVKVPVKADLNLTVSATATARRPIDPMGMNKVGSQSPSVGTNTWTTLTGFAADPNFPMTNLVDGNKLVVNGAGSVTISASVRWTEGLANKTIRVLINGVVAATSATERQSAFTQTGDFVATVAAGDVIELQANCETGGRNGIGASPTFLRYTVNA